MDPTPLLALVATAAFIGVVHTLAGPDHYVPFIALARARRWSVARTVGVTLSCGVGHVMGSVLLGAVGIAVGLALGHMEWIESVRGEVAGWLLLGFGLAYGSWGLRRAWRDRPHSHWHAHAHVHQGARRSVTPWVLFVLFVFGPCEALIPVLMVPAAAGTWWQVAAVTTVFGVCTLGTMTAAVLAGYHGLARLSLSGAARWSHALAGLALAVCGAAIQLGL